jgi:hypothetical protein
MQKSSKELSLNSRKEKRSPLLVLPLAGLALLLAGARGLRLVGIQLDRLIEQLEILG